MTLKHFMAATKPLPTGEYGYVYEWKRISELKHVQEDLIHKGFKKEELENKYIQVFDTEKDASGINISPLNPGYKTVNEKFKLPYVYEVFGHLSGRGHSFHRKCMQVLLNYIDQHIFEGEEVEIYSCWDGEEHMEKDEKLDLFISLSSIKNGHALDDKVVETIEFLERQYVLIRK